MIPTYPWCAGRTAFHPRPHVLTGMRIERSSAGALPIYRCPDCHHTTPMYTLEPLDQLVMCDQYAAIISRDIADHGRDWSDPVRIRFTDDPTDPRLITIEVTRPDGEKVAS